MISPHMDCKQDSNESGVSTPCTQSHAPRLTSSAPSFETRKAAWNGDSSSPEYHGDFGSKWLRHLDGDLSMMSHFLNTIVDPSPYMDPDFPQEEWRHFSYTQSDAYRADFVNAALAARSCPDGGEFDFDPVAQCVLFCPQYVQPLADDAGNATKTYINEIARTWQHSGDLEEYEIKDKKHAYAYAVPGKVVNAVRSQLSPAAAKYLAQAWQIITFSDNPDNAHDATAIRYKWFDDVEGRYVDVTNDDIEKIIPRLRPGITSKQALRSVSTLILSCARVVTQVRDGNKIYCAGGDQVLDLTQYGTEKFASTPDPGTIAVNVLPYRYDPSVYSEDGERLLDAFANNDPEIRKTLEEVGGTCMSSGDTPLVWFVGDLLSADGREKANGKSTCMDLIRVCAGDANNCEFKLRDYSGEYTRARLRDKTVVTDSDMSSDMLDSDTISELKVASGKRDMITSNVKYSSHITFPATHTQLVASNTLPVLSAKDLATGAMDRRWKFVPFLNYFGELPNGEMSPEYDPDLVERVLGTKDGAIKPDEKAMTYIFTCFIDGLMRYRAQGRQFTESDYSRRVRRQIQLNNNSILNWAYSSDTPLKLKMFLGYEANPEVNEACLEGENGNRRYGAKKWMVSIPVGVRYSAYDEDKVLVRQGTTACVSAFYAAYQQFCEAGGYYKVSRRHFKKAMHTLFGLNESPRVIRCNDGSKRSARVFLLDPQFESYAQGLAYLRGDRWYDDVVQAPEVPDDFDPLSILDPDFDPDGPDGGGVPIPADTCDDAACTDADDCRAMADAICDVCNEDGVVHGIVAAPLVVMACFDKLHHQVGESETPGKSMTGDLDYARSKFCEAKESYESYLEEVSLDDHVIGDCELASEFVDSLAEAAGAMCAETTSVEGPMASVLRTPEQRQRYLESMVESVVGGVRELAGTVRLDREPVGGKPNDAEAKVLCEAREEREQAYRKIIVDVLTYVIAKMDEYVALDDRHLRDEIRYSDRYMRESVDNHVQHDIVMRRLASLVQRLTRHVEPDTVSIDEVLGDSDVDDADGDRKADVEAGSE